MKSILGIQNGQFILIKIVSFREERYLTLQKTLFQFVITRSLCNPEDHIANGKLKSRKESLNILRKGMIFNLNDSKL